MRTILITGGAGYIGSTLVRLLLEKGSKVLVIDNLLFGGYSLEGFCDDPNFNLIKGDITSPQTISEIFRAEKIDSIVHMAAIVGDPACAKDPMRAQDVNLNGSSRLLEAARNNKVKRFIFTSTCSNYGKMSSQDVFVDEKSALAPVSLYAELKVKFEKVLFEGRAKDDGFCPTILRFATAYGLSPRMRFDLTVNEFTKELALKRELEIFGGQFWRPYCHVFDLARAILLALNADEKKVAYNVFNVGDSKENFQKQMLVDEIKKMIPDARVKYVQKVEDPRDYRVSFEKIKNELGFKITKTVRDGIREIKEAIDKKMFLDVDSKKYRNC